MLMRLKSPEFRTAALLLAGTGLLWSQQSNQFVHIQPKLDQLDRQQTDKLIIADLTPVSKPTKPQVDPADLVGQLPAAMPSAVAWEVSGVKWAGSPPLFTADGLFVAARDRKLRCLDPKTGKELWSTKLKGAAANHLVPGLLLGLDNGTLVSVDPRTGKVRWTASLEDAGGGALFQEEVQPISQPVLQGDRIYVGTFSQGVLKNGGKLYALDAATGKPLWVKALPFGVTRAPVVEGDAVWAGGGAHYGAYACKDGQELGAFKVQEAPLGSATGQGPRFFFTSGKAVFSADTARHELAPMPSLPLGQGFASQDGFVAGGQDGLLVLDAVTGKEAWHKPGALAGAPVLNGGRLFALTNDKALYIYNLKDGKPLAGFALSEEPKFTRALVHGDQAMVLGKRPKGLLLETFQGPDWKRGWALAVSDALVTLPTFSPQGMLLWTEADQLRMIR